MTVKRLASWGSCLGFRVYGLRFYGFREGDNDREALSLLGQLFRNVA